MVGNHRTIYNESLIYLSLKLNPFSKKSEPILQNEPIRILYPFRSPFTKRKVAQAAFSFCTFHSSLFTLHFSLTLPRDFSREEIREKREKVAFLLRLWLFGRKALIFSKKCDIMISKRSKSKENKHYEKNRITCSRIGSICDASRWLCRKIRYG